MKQDHSSISRFKTTYLLVILSLVAATFTQGLCDGQGLTPTQLALVQNCIDGIAVEGPICQVPIILSPTPITLNTLELYGSREEYCCAALGVYQGLPYFQVAPIEDPLDCDPSIGLCNIYSETPFVKMQILSEKGNFQCFMLDSERCYRKETQELFFSNKYEVSKDNAKAATVTEEENCCTFECDELFSADIGGCGSDGIFYREFSEFCSKFCKNRTLKITACGDDANGIDCIDHPQCPSQCETNTRDVPSCGSDGVLYANNRDLCAAYDGNKILRYDQCGINGCVQADCALNQCYQDLLVNNYRSNSICGASGNWYVDISLYCDAIVAGDEYFYTLCDGAPCVDSNQCCLRACNNDECNDMVHCTTSFQWYDNRATYCNEVCTNGVQERLCDGNNCTEEQCCNAQCMASTFYNVCNTVDGLLVDPAAFCEAKGCNANPPFAFTLCFDNNGFQIDCTQAMCEKKACEAWYGAGPRCGNGNRFYLSVSQFCEALLVTKEIQLEIQCDDNACTTRSSCCVANCLQSEFRDGYQPLCDTQFVQYPTLESYCTKLCQPFGINVLMCNNGNDICTLEECCVESCPTNASLAICDSNFNLVPGVEDCENNCLKNHSQNYRCNGGCEQSDCDYNRCYYDILGDLADNDNVCYTNNLGNIFSDNKVGVCNTYKANPLNINIFRCVDGQDCSSPAGCAISRCILDDLFEHTVCDFNYSYYDNIVDYCTAKQNLVSFRRCEGNTRNCNERECCNLKCNQEFTHDICSRDYFEVCSPAVRCRFRCDGDWINRPDVAVYECNDQFDNPRDCQDQDCQFFKCIAAIESYQYSNICINSETPNEMFFDSHMEYCQYLWGEGVRTYLNEPINAIPCNNAECSNSEDCCISACMADEVNFLEYCDIDAYVVIDLETHCTRKCRSTLPTRLNCLGRDCELRDCKLRKCEDEVNNVQEGFCLLNEVVNRQYYSSVNVYCNIVVDEITNYSIFSNEVQCHNGASPCLDDDECCVTKCLRRSYINACDKVDFNVINHQTFCERECATGYSTADQDLCFNGLGIQVPCLDCKIFECRWDIRAHPYTTICLYETDFSFDFYLSHTAYCNFKIANLQVDYQFNNNNDCNNGCDDHNDCCYNVCMLENYLGKCTDDHVFYNQDAYCRARCNNTLPKLNLCDGQACTRESCEMIRCLGQVCFLFREICLDTEISGQYYFNGREAYCLAKINAQETDYVPVPVIYCDNEESANTEGRCEDINQCCHARCMHEEFLDACDPNSFDLLTKKEFCDFRCATTNPPRPDMDFRHCEDANGNRIACSLDHCRHFACLNHLSNLNVNGYCGVDDVYYLEEMSFCNMFDNNVSNLRQCNNGGQLGLCTNDTNCCFANCMQRDFVPMCDRSNYNWITSQTQYCQLYCGNGRSFNAFYYEEGVLATQVQCCREGCDLNTNHFAVCNANDWTLIQPETNCRDLCDTRDLIIRDCGNRSCDETDCEIFQCEALTGDANPTVCGNDGVFYPSNLSYCNEKIRNNNNLHWQLCGNVPCPDAPSCCEANCVNNNRATFTPFCNTNYHQFLNVEDYCEWQCRSDNVTPLTCGIDLEPCTIQECCDQECNNTPRFTTCDCLDDFLLLTQSVYCDKKCNHVDFHEEGCPNRNCNVRDCNIKRCEKEMDSVHEAEEICANTGNFYVSHNNFCEAKEDGLLTDFFLCPVNQLCNTPADCCHQVCLFNNRFEYESRCTSNFQWLETVEEYCTSWCNGGHVDLLCDNNEFCTQAECCAEECETQVYTPVCDVNFNYLDKQTFCSRNCPDKNLSVINCQGGCTPQLCELQKCEFALSSRRFTSICLITPYAASNFYLSITAYCQAKISNNDTDYTVNFNNEARCVNQLGTQVNCDDGEDCCIALCLRNEQNTVCDQDYQLQTPLQICQRQCDSISNNNVVKRNCFFGNSIIDCLSCQQFECEDRFTGVTGAICTRATTPIWFQNSTDLCQDVLSDPNVTVQDAINGIINCSGGCSSTQCCIENCKLNNLGYLNQCRLDNDTVYTIDHFCANQCAGITVSTDGCDGRNCLLSDCRIKECQEVIFATSSICLITKLFGRNYFANELEYCTYYVANTSNDFNNFTLTSNTSCVGGAVCTGTRDCCVMRCLNNNVHSTCDINDNYALVTDDQYCDYLCDNNGHENDNPTDLLNVYECSNGLNQINCSAFDCRMERCRQAFVANNYPFGTVCLDFTVNGFYFYTSVDNYCSAQINTNGNNFDYQYPSNDLNSCSSGECVDADDCCMTRCEEETYFTSCDENHELVNQQEYCSFRCAASNPNRINMTVFGCGNAHCATCDNRACEAAVANYPFDNVCLISGQEVNGISFFTSKENYCTAKLGTGETDFSLGGKIHNCNNNLTGCADSEACCVQRCLALTWFNKCNNADDTVFTNELAYCNDICSPNPQLSLHSCGATTHCTNLDCCVNESNVVPICDDTGFLHSTRSSFCNARIGSLVTDIGCGAGLPCNTYNCWMNFCQTESIYVNDNFGRCDENYVFRSSLAVFCDAKFSNRDLDLMSEARCVGVNCGQVQCCDLQCDDNFNAASDDAVIVIIDGVATAFQNACKANTCRGHTVVYTCVNTAPAACLTEYENSCDIHCNHLLNAPETYCGNTNQFYSAYQYCVNITCPVNAWVETVGCENGVNCTQQQCNLQLCLGGCSTVQAQVCGDDGNLYFNLCHLQCYVSFGPPSVTVTASLGSCSSFLPDYPNCGTRCSFLACYNNCNGYDNYVCGNDQNLYPDECTARCSNTNVFFNCPLDCADNSVRMTRCSFNCVNSRFYEDDL